MNALVLSGGAAHGAYQAGVIRALEEMEWNPDLVCGTSVGAINGAAVASGIDGEELSRIWRGVETDQVYRWRDPTEWLRFWKWKHLMDTNPLRDFLSDILNEERLKTADRHYVCFGVDVRSMKLVAFANRTDGPVGELEGRYEIRPADVDAVLGSSAIPLVFPWVSGVWDGSILQHTPLKPAVWMGADEIVVVNIGQPGDSLPGGPIESVLRLVNITAESRFRHDISRIRRRNNMEGYREIGVTLIRPSGDIPYSKMDFSSSMKAEAIHMGYEDAIREMEDT